MTLNAKALESLYAAAVHARKTLTVLYESGRKGCAVEAGVFADAVNMLCDAIELAEEGE